MTGPLPPHVEAGAVVCSRCGVVGADGHSPDCRAAAPTVVTGVLTGVLSPPPERAYTTREAEAFATGARLALNHRAAR